jgi:hypothetical protein
VGEEEEGVCGGGWWWWLGVTLNRAVTCELPFLRTISFPFIIVLLIIVCVMYSGLWVEMNFDK